MEHAISLRKKHTLYFVSVSSLEWSVGGASSLHSHSQKNGGYIAFSSPGAV